MKQASLRLPSRIFLVSWMIACALTLFLAACSGNNDKGGSVPPPPPPPPPDRPLSITAVSPPAQAISAARDTALTITFAEPLDPSTVDSLSVYVFGRWSGVAQGVITLEENDTRVRFTPDKPFMAGEWVTALLSDRVQSAMGKPLRGGYTWNFWTKAEPGSLDLTSVSNLPIRLPGEGRILSYGAYAGDLDGDGFSDLLVPNEAPNDIRVFMNDTQGGYSGGFVTYVIPDGANPSPNDGADFNRDGILDVAVGNRMNEVVS
ncbi:MAG: Ig-like domain-containing protein, partial [Gammaproteobacteria bacterium]